jgi:hypothetical protein
VEKFADLTKGDRDGTSLPDPKEGSAVVSKSKQHETVWVIYEKRVRFSEGSPTWRKVPGTYSDRKEAEGQLGRLDKASRWAIRKLRVLKNQERVTGGEGGHSQPKGSAA